jgi:UDP-glucose 4-epimerase
VGTLVIGCGFIGSNVATRLAATGEPPLVLTHHPPAAEVLAAIGEGNLNIADATDADAIVALLDGVEHVAYCAGGPLPYKCEEDPEGARELTLGPLMATLEALRRKPGPTLTYLSSGGTVYGSPRPEELPVDESFPTAPSTTYGRLHRECEEAIEAVRAESGLDSRILRCATVYGEHQRPGRGQGVIVTFLDRIANGAPIEVYGDGSTIRDYVYVGDVADAVIALTALDDAPPVINVGSGEAASLVDVLELVKAEVGKPAAVDQKEERGFDIHQIVLDTTLLHGTIELEMTPLRTGIAHTHRWLDTLEPGPGPV